MIAITLTRTNKQTKKGVHLLCKIISLHLFDTSIMQKLFISLTAASLQLRKELHEIHQTEVELHFLYHQSTSELSCMDLKSYHEFPFLRTEKVKDIIRPLIQIQIQEKMKKSTTV